MQLFIKIFLGSGVTTLIISNEEMNDIMKIVKFLEEAVLLIKEGIKNEAKENEAKLKMKQKNKKEGFLEYY